MLTTIKLLFYKKVRYTQIIALIPCKIDFRDLTGF